MGEEEVPPEWDLSRLVKSTDPADVKKDLDTMLDKSKAIAARYKGHIAQAKPKQILALYRDIDSAYPNMYQRWKYADLLFSADATNSVSCELFEYARNINAKFESELKFLDLELAKTLQHRPGLIDDSVLSEFKHALEKLRETGKYQLAESSEQLILEKNRYGIESWFLLHDALRGSRRFEMEIEGQNKEFGLLELQALAMSDSRRSVRMRASDALHEGLAKDRLTWSYALRSIFGDYLGMMRLRKAPDIFTLSLLSNDISRNVLDGLIRAIQSNVGLIRRYLDTKAKITGLSKLAGFDLDAPVSGSERQMSWKELRTLVVDIYSHFDEDIGGFVSGLFENRKVDARTRPGKTGFGFCASVPSLRTSWIMMNYVGSLLDAKTLAHEVGHAIHDYLASEKHAWTNLDAGLCLAETASTFGELLLTDRQLGESHDDSARISILCSTLDGFRLYVFDMLVRFRFEANAFSALENNENLDADKLDTLWSSAREEVYGDAVDWSPGTESWWAFPPHHYFPDTRFYNYPYAFGKLLVFALYGLYKEQGLAFVPKMKQILSSGGSKSPEQLLGEIGFNIAGQEFWEIGFSQARAFLEELEKLVKRT